MHIIDTDPGLDDAHAIAMATRLLPHDELVVTTVAGNVGLDAVTANAAWLLAQWAPQVPLYRGAAAPLVGEMVDAAHIHGDDGLAGFPRTPTPFDGPTTPAAVAIADLVRALPGEVDIVALGPLTNIALALALEPRLPELVRSLTVMGGSPAQHGNASLNAEYNVYADPAAAEVVLARMTTVTLLTWDTCLTHRFSRAELADFFGGTSAEARLLARLHEHRLAHDPAYAALTDYGRADPLAMAAALAPACVATTTSHGVQVVHDGGRAHGVTVVDERDALDGRPRVRLVETFHRPALVHALTI